LHDFTKCSKTLLNENTKSNTLSKKLHNQRDKLSKSAAKESDSIKKFEQLAIKAIQDKVIKLEQEKNEHVQLKDADLEKQETLLNSLLNNIVMNKAHCEKNSDSTEAIQGRQVLEEQLKAIEENKYPLQPSEISSVGYKLLQEHEIVALLNNWATIELKKIDEKNSNNEEPFKNDDEPKPDFNGRWIIDLENSDSPLAYCTALGYTGLLLKASARFPVQYQIYVCKEYVDVQTITMKPFPFRFPLDGTTHSAVHDLGITKTSGRWEKKDGFWNLVTQAEFTRPIGRLTEVMSRRILSDGVLEAQFTLTNLDSGQVHTMRRVFASRNL